MSTVITNGTVVTAGGTFNADIRVDGGKISAIGLDLASGADTVIDAGGKHVLPGGIDVHTHLAMPSEPASVSCTFSYAAVRPLNCSNSSGVLYPSVEC